MQKVFQPRLNACGQACTALYRSEERRVGKECDLRKSRSSPTGRQGCSSILRHAIVTEWPRRQGRLGGASLRRRDRGIERSAGLPAGAMMCKSGKLHHCLKVAVHDSQTYYDQVQIKLSCLSPAVAFLCRDTMDKTKRCQEKGGYMINKIGEASALNVANGVADANPMSESTLSASDLGD